MVDLSIAIGRTLVRGVARLPLGALFGRPIHGEVPDGHLAALAAAYARMENRLLAQPPVAARTAFRQATQLAATSAPQLYEVRDLTLADRATRLYVPRAPEARTPVLVYFHGGGGTIGDLDTADDGCRWLASISGWAVASVDYRLGPEDPYPAALDDAIAAFRAVSEQREVFGWPVARVAVGGDSFGAMLATQVCRRAARGGGPMPAAQLLVYPVCDYVRPTESRRAFGQGLLLSERVLASFHERAFARLVDAHDEWASPLLAPSLVGQPPALVVTAALDPLRDEGRAYAERLSQASARVEQLELPRMLHGFVNFMGLSPGAHAAWRKVSERWGAFAW